MDPFDRRSMALSIAMHLAILVFGWASTFYEPPQMEFVTYEIELVSPPPAQQAEEPREATEEIVVERPEPEPAPPEPEPEEVVPVEDPEPEPEPEPEEEVVEQPPEVAEETVTAASDEPAEETPTESGEDLNVRIEGLRRDFPVYYENIIRQINRCLRWREGGSWETTIYFAIDREGNAHDLQFVSRSGSAAFDYAAMGAVECAGRGRFGPLPEDLPYDRFPVRFRFRPSRAPELLMPLLGSAGVVAAPPVAQW